MKETISPHMTIYKWKIDGFFALYHRITAIFIFLISFGFCFLFLIDENLPMNLLNKYTIFALFHIYSYHIIYTIKNKIILTFEKKYFKKSGMVIFLISVLIPIVFIYFFIWKSNLEKQKT